MRTTSDLDAAPATVRNTQLRAACGPSPAVIHVDTDPDVGARKQPERRSGKARIRISTITVDPRQGVWGIPIPLLMDGYLVRPRISVDQPAHGVR